MVLHSCGGWSRSHPDAIAGSRHLLPPASSGKCGQGKREQLQGRAGGSGTSGAVWVSHALTGKSPGVQLGIDAFPLIIYLTLFLLNLQRRDQNRRVLPHTLLRETGAQVVLSPALPRIWDIAAGQEGGVGWGTQAAQTA